jgi:hypothetical protein
MNLGGLKSRSLGIFQRIEDCHGILKATDFTGLSLGWKSLHLALLVLSFGVLLLDALILVHRDTTLSEECRTPRYLLWMALYGSLEPHTLQRCWIAISESLLEGRVAHGWLGPNIALVIVLSWWQSPVKQKRVNMTECLCCSHIGLLSLFQT